VIEMIETGRPCVDIAQQLDAVEKAIQQAKKALIHDHLNHCPDDAMTQDGLVDRAAIDSFREITRYL
jgi:DNA-binding FrmR family transcriptional regulator